MKNKFVFFIVFSVLFLLAGCSISFNESVDILHYQSVTGNSAASAVCDLLAFYGRLDLGGHDDLILPYIKDSTGKINLALMVNVLNLFSNNSTGARLISFPATDDGQNRALSQIASCVMEDRGSILILDTNFYTPIVRATGRKYDNRPPRADSLSYINDNFNRVDVMANELKTRMRPINGMIWIIVCEYSNYYYNQGESNYQWFKSESGTYYGAPANYKPSTDFSVL